MPAYDLTGATTRPIPGSALGTLRNVLGLQDNDGVGALGDMSPEIEAQSLHGMREGEAADNLTADPTNRRLQLINQMLASGDKTDPYSDQNTGAEAVASNAATAEARRAMDPTVMAAKAQAIKDAGSQAQSVARGTAAGTGEGNWTTPSQNVADAASTRKIAESVAPIQAQMGGAGGAGNPVVANLADAYKKDPTILAQVPAHLKDAVVALAASGGPLNGKLTNQTKQMSESANDLLPMIDNVQGQAKELEKLGLFQPGVGTVRNFLASHGMGSMMGMGPDVAEKIGRFNSDLGLLQSGVARAHAGARGAGNSGIAERFEKLMASQGDVPTFLGGLNGVRDLLKVYAAHTNGAPATADPYSDPNWGGPQ